jgi:hypothetical protein
MFGLSFGGLGAWGKGGKSGQKGGAKTLILANVQKPWQIENTKPLQNRIFVLYNLLPYLPLTIFLYGQLNVYLRH